MTDWPLAKREPAGLRVIAEARSVCNAPCPEGPGFKRLFLSVGWGNGFPFQSPCATI